MFDSFFKVKDRHRKGKNNLYLCRHSARKYFENPFLVLSIRF